jgi:hypothetical protein
VVDDARRADQEVQGKDPVLTLTPRCDPIGFAESHAAAVKHPVITIENTIGRMKR